MTLTGRKWTGGGRANRQGQNTDRNEAGTATATTVSWAVAVLKQPVKCTHAGCATAWAGCNLLSTCNGVVPLLNTFFIF